MDKQDNYSTSFPGLDYSLDHDNQYQHHQKSQVVGHDESSREHDLNDSNLELGGSQYMFHNQHQLIPSSSASLDKLSFADVMQFADFGPKLGLNQAEKEIGIDPVYFLKFPVLNEQKMVEEDVMAATRRQMSGEEIEEQMGNGNDIGATLQTDQFVGDQDQAQLQQQELDEKKTNSVVEVKSKRKRTRTVKTSEEVESQRMTHIAVERNRRKQMNEHLRVLRSLMPGSYVQRGDQASIIGGAIEFVRELEQLLQCLESQKRRKLYGEAPNPSLGIQQQPNDQQPPMFPPLPLQNDQMNMEAAGLHEVTAESKSCLADVEVKVLGFDAMIKILSRRRPGQLIKIIAALEDLQFNILHTNITTIEQTVLYSFNVKIAGESRFGAEDIASSVQQIFNFIHVNSSICDAI